MEPCKIGWEGGKILTRTLYTSETKAACSIDRSSQRTPVTDYPLQTILVMEPIGCRAPQKELLLDAKLLHAEETVRPCVGVFSYIAVTRKASRKCLSVDLCLRSSISFFRLTRRACWHVVVRLSSSSDESTNPDQSNDLFQHVHVTSKRPIVLQL